MLHYAMAHWRGEQGLVQSTLINGLGGYAFLVVVFLGLSTTVFTSQSFFRVGLCVFFAWQIWASVGILRASVRRTFDSSAPVGPRLGGAIAIVAVLVVGVLGVRDALRFFG
jgi:hypothetical protein